MGFIYKPTHQRQIVAGDKYGGYNCTAYSAAMAIDRATMGGTLVTGKLIRQNSNEPVPDPASPGLSLPQIVNVAFKWHVELENRGGAPWTAFIKALKEGRGVVLQGDYDQLGSEYSCQSSFKGNHAVYVNHVTGNDELYWYDPLCSGPRNVPMATGKAYAEKFAKSINVSPGILFATTRVTPNLATAQ